MGCDHEDEQSHENFNGYFIGWVILILVLLALLLCAAYVHVNGGNGHGTHA